MPADTVCLRCLRALVRRLVPPSTYPDSWYLDKEKLWPCYRLLSPISSTMATPENLYIALEPWVRSVWLTSRDCKFTTDIRQDKALHELKALMKYRASQLGHTEDFRGLGLSSRKNLCLHPSVKRDRNARCRGFIVIYNEPRIRNLKKVISDAIWLGTMFQSGITKPNLY